MLSSEHWLGLSESHVAPCQDGFILLPEVCAAFRQMQEAAAQDNVDLRLVSAFRSFDRQLVIWNGKWNGQRPLYDRQENLLNADTLNDTDKLFSILIWSALPGGSRHHWGTDMDVYDKAAVERGNHDFQLKAEEYQPGGPCYDLSCWLDEHVERFGFYRPYAKFTGGVSPEPWHLSFRPIAAEIITNLSKSSLANAIEQTEISGKEVILSNLGSIYTDYILNGEPQ